VASQIQSIVDEGNFILENSQNAAFDFTATPPNNFRMSTARVGDYNLYIMSETIEEILKGLDDPRISTLFREAANAPGTYNGLLNGPDASQLSISVGDFSLTGAIFRENAGLLDANYMTAAETHFLLAEAAERDLITGDAQSYYEEGVRLAFEYWQTDLPADYLTTGPALYSADDSSPLEQIITQKWLMNIGNGYEGWIEYRRTGFPVLKTISASLNNDVIPVRMPYPTTEETLNAVNYQQAFNATDGNSVNAGVWWDL
ncbi:MAG: SusD/RagB family nutrient-binding outer membrane lipoprotein, partial [Bacteroidota bacterium]